MDTQGNMDKDVNGEQLTGALVAVVPTPTTPSGPDARDLTGQAPPEPVASPAPPVVIAAPNIVGSETSLQTTLPQVGGRFIRNPVTGEITELTVVESKDKE